MNLPEQTPDAVLAARLASGHTQAQAAKVARYGSKVRWSEAERGVRRLDIARWELYLLLTDQHPDLHVAPRSEPHV